MHARVKDVMTANVVAVGALVGVVSEADLLAEEDQQ